ncbi:ArsR family transcriptional regulator (plasmid) [Halorarum halophilum]|uniref:ArsR family transcriptional regulator n=1 Tax=Halorarum halophilum TaxID=2743090 RepID=A0A7D5GEG3_9EURY|nr:ArsR family transcriptional regulator [Halobaculum halophilum]QLG29786.1 ArsR family transcriptional regulator [Halobaculum halophilum]
MNSSQSRDPDEAVAADEDSSLEGQTDEATSEEVVEEELPLDIIFEVLKNERRRLVLEYLRDAEGSVTIGELAEHIAALENDITPAELNAQQRKRVYIGLYQCHLPKMDDADAVAFNQDRGIVELGRSAETLFEYLDSDSEVESNGHLRQYTMFSVFGGLAFLFAHVAGTPLLPELIVIAVLIGVPAVAYYAER